MQRKWIPLAVFFAILLVFLAHLGGRISAVPAFTYAAEEKIVYLTFDDGPSTLVTERVLDTLKEENIKATFFIVGKNIAGRESTLRRIAAEGHTLGVHSDTHVYSDIYASKETFLRDVDRCAERIIEVTGVTPRYYRFPGGGLGHEKEYAPLLAQKGYRVKGWNAVCGDGETAGANADMLVAKAASTAKGRRSVVLLCHDAAGHFATADALPRIIAHFREEGYVFRSFSADS